DPGGPYAGTLNTGIVFNGTASKDPDGNPLSFAWSFGDGTAASGPAPVHAFSQPGLHTVTLLVSDGRGGTSSASTLATVTAVSAEVPGNHAPTASAGGPYNGIAQASVTLHGEGLGDADNDPLTYAWSFGDGTTGTGATPVHIYLQPGRYTATLLVADGRGGSDAATAVVVIGDTPQSSNGPPTAAAGGPYAGPTGTAIDFAASASDPDGDPLAYAWSFGDGTSGDGATPTHRYLTAGVYDVTLLVTDGRGGAVAAATTATISAVAGNQPPMAQPGGPYLGVAGQPIAFIFSGTDADGDALTFAAAFGDGVDGTGPSPSHAYEYPGTYIVTLVVSDGRGGVASVQTAAVISAEATSGNRPPVARAGGPYSVLLGQPVSLDGSASSDPDAADTLTFAWTLGDGANAAGAQPSHLFAAAGTYPIVLLVSDGHGGTSSASASVVVTAAAVPQNQNPTALAGGPYSATVAAAVPLSSAGSSDPDGDTLTFSWNFGDGSSGSGPAPSHAWAAAGDYTITLLVTDGRGGSATASAAAHVEPPAAANHPPVANAGGPYAGAPGAVIALSGAASSDPDQDALTFSWNFGDNSQPGSGPTPSHAYQTAGAYTVTLTVTDARGATSSAIASAVIGAVVDRGPPVVTLNAPSEALPGSRITVTAQATDDVAVALVRFEVSGAEATTTQTAPYQRTIDVPAVVAPGATIQVRAIATDSSSKSAQADATIRISFVADTESPLVALRAPASAAPGSTVLLSATASDNVGIGQVAFLLNGTALSVDTEAPYEASFVVPADAVVGSSLPVVARARDFAGNQADSGAAVVVSGSSDTTPPTVSLTAPPQVARGGTLALAASADDAGGIYAVSFFVDGVRVGVDTTAPYTAAFKLPLSVAGGTTLQLRAVARDFAGNEAEATGASAVESPSGAGRGVLTGEVYDDRTGLPLSNVTITLTGADDDTQPYAATGITDGRGRYVVRAERGVGVLHIAKSGFTSVDRQVSIVASRAQEVIDARLTSLEPSVSISPVLGGFAGPEAARVTLPSGAIDGELQLSVTPIGQQALQGLLPIGWVPIAAADVRPHGVAFPAPVPLSMKSGLALPAGSTLVLAVWDEEQSAWRALSGTAAGGVAPQIDGSIEKTGQFAWLLADRAPAAPPAPAAGQLLAGATGAVIPPQTTPRIDPQPKIAFYNPGISAAVRAYVDTAAALPSGSVLWINVSENYRFFSGAETHPEPFVQDLVFYQAPDAPLSQVAAFPATPSQVFDALTLERGVISLEMIVPPADPAAAPLAGPDGATISSGDISLAIPAGALGDATPFDLRRLQPTDLGIALPTGLEFLGGAQIGFGGTLAAPAALSLPAPAGSADNVLLVRLQDIQGQTRLVLSGIGSVVSGRLVSVTSVGGSGQLDGVRAAGRYIFFRAAAPVGFAAGHVLGVGGAPFPAALVTTSGLPVVSLSAPTGAYVAAAAAGAATLTALDVVKSDSGAAATTIAASQVSPLDLRLVAQAPRVVAVVPAAGTQNVALGTPVVVTFSEPVDPASVGSGGDVAVTPAGGAALTGTFSLSNGNTVLTFRPGAPLEPNKRYTITVGTSLRDLAGYAIESAVSSVFDSLDTAPPPQPAAGAVTASLPLGGNTTVRGSQGTASPHDTVTVVNVTTGAITPVLVDANGGFTTLVVAAPTDLLKVRIVDQAGNEITVGIPRFTQTNADGSVSTAIGSEGGRVLGPGGLAADVAAGTFLAGAVVTLNVVPEAQFPVAIPTDQQQRFGFNGAFSIDFGGVVPTRYVNVSIPALGGETVTDQWLVTQVVDVNGTPGLNVVDTAKFINGRIATSSPPCPGVTAAGVYGIHKSFQSVGLNYGLMQNTGYGALVARFNSPLYGFLPFLSYVPDIQIPTPVCYPVLTGRVTVVPNSVRVTVDGPQLTPADREIIVRNGTRASENRFPRNVIELSLEMPGKDSDSYQVKAISAAQEVVLSGVSVTPGQAGFVTLRPDPDRISVPVQAFRIRNISTGVTRDYPQTLAPLPLTAAGGPSDSFQVFIVDVNGVQRSATFVLDASQYGPGNLLLRALPGTIDPTRSEMDAAGVQGPARTRVLLTSSGGLSTEIPAVKIVSGGTEFSFDGNPTDTFFLAVQYDSRGDETIQIPNIQVTVSNPRTGRVIRTLTLQAPPRDEPQSIGVVSDDVTAPFVTAGPSQLTNFDPSAAISFTFSEGMDAQSVKDGLIVRDAAGNRVLGEVRISSGNRVATFVPFAALKLGTDYRLTLVGNDALGTLLEPGMGAGIKDASGNALSTMRLTISTFKPRLVSTLASVFGVKDFAIRRRKVNNVLSTYLMAAVDPNGGALLNGAFGGQNNAGANVDKFVTLDLTNPEAPVKVGGNNEYAPARKRIALMPDVSFQQWNNITFTGDLAVTTTYNSYYTFLTFYDVTDPANPKAVGGKLMTATPDTLTNFSQRGTFHVLGFGRGVTTLKTATGVNAYAAVEQVGIMSADVAQNIPERGFDTRIKEGLYPGDFTDVAAFNDRLIALEKSGHQLVVLDPALAPLLSFDLPAAPRRLKVVEGYQTDDNHDGLIQPNEIRDLAVIGTDTGILVVNISDFQNVQILASIPMPGIVRELDVDPVRQRAFAATDTKLFMIDLSRPGALGSTDADGDGIDDRIIWQTTTQYANGIGGVRLDSDRGLLYVGGPGGTDTWAVYDNCCDLGVEMTGARHERQTGNRTELLQKEKDALKQGISKGLTEAAVTCTVTTGTMSILEQGSGACLWTDNPGVSCSANYQPGVSDHDFEVFFPASVAAPAQKCVIDKLQEQFTDPVTKEPKEITLNGSKVAFEDITFFPVSKDAFEAAKLDVLPPAPSPGSDSVGDAGLGRQQLLLKWLLEGQYVTVPQLASTAQPLETILARLRTSTSISPVEGYEWSILQGFNLAKSKALIRIKGSSKPDSAFRDLFIKQVHDAGKSGIRTALARMVAHDGARAQVLDITRLRFEQNACLEILPEVQDPNRWREGPCDSFEEYVASAAARTLRGVT
ncbi:MAG: PKD domain-containing protein, partial [Acidobacteriota bacterium]